MIGIKYYPKCYFYTLTDSERAEIHTRDGRRKLEVGVHVNRFLRLLQSLGRYFWWWIVNVYAFFKLLML